MSVYLFSKSDQDSKEIFQYIAKTNYAKNHVTPLSVDSPEVYGIIESSTNINVENIPCLFVTQGEQIFKYEGRDKIIEVINEMEKIYRPKSTQPSYTNLSDILNVEDTQKEEQNTKPENIKITSPPIGTPMTRLSNK